MTKLKHDTDITHLLGHELKIIIHFQDNDEKWEPKKPCWITTAVDRLDWNNYNWSTYTKTIHNDQKYQDHREKWLKSTLLCDAIQLHQRELQYLEKIPSFEMDDFKPVWRSNYNEITIHNRGIIILGDGKNQQIQYEPYEPYGKEHVRTIKSVTLQSFQKPWHWREFQDYKQEEKPKVCYSRNNSYAIQKILEQHLEYDTQNQQLKMQHFWIQDLIQTRIMLNTMKIDLASSTNGGFENNEYYLSDKDRSKIATDSYQIFMDTIKWITAQILAFKFSWDRKKVGKI